MIKSKSIYLFIDMVVHSPKMTKEKKRIEKKKTKKEFQKNGIRIIMKIKCLVFFYSEKKI